MEKLKEIFNEFDKHLMEDEKPSDYFNEKLKEEIMINQYPLDLLEALKNTEQSPKYHSEGSVWNHTMLVTDEAAKRKNLSREPKVFMWAALLHDLGKASTTKLRKGKITSYDHDKAGEVLAVKFLKEFNCEREFINKVSKLVRWHMQPFFVVKKLPFAEAEKMCEEVSIEEVALLSLCDRLGRGDMDEEKIHNEKSAIEEFLKLVNKYSSKCEKKFV